MKKILIFTSIFLSVFILSSCSNAKEQNEVQLTLAAAASLTNPMNEIIQNFESNNPNYDVVLSFSSSGSLLKQIEEGAPIDIFLSASTSKFDSLLDNKISKENSQILLSNAMSLITYKEKVFSDNEDKTGHNNFTNYTYSIGDPESVPAGRYAYETINNLNFWTEDNENQITAKSVRQVLSYVETKNVEYGIVYSSDAYNNDNVKIVREFDSSLHSPINYPIGILDDSDNESTRKLYEYLISDDALKVFLEYGFKEVTQ